MTCVCFLLSTVPWLMKVPFFPLFQNKGDLFTGPPFNRPILPYTAQYLVALQSSECYLSVEFFTLSVGHVEATRPGSIYKLQPGLP
jgi:hypothetical protein